MIERRNMVTGLAVVAGLLGAASTATAGAAEVALTDAVTEGKANVVSLEGGLTFNGPANYETRFCIEDRRRDASGAGVTFHYTYADGSTHKTRTWRHDSGAGTRACHHARVAWPPAIRTIRVVLSSDKFGSAERTYANPHVGGGQPPVVIKPVESKTPAALPRPRFRKRIDRYARVQEYPDRCAPKLKPGVKAVADLLVAAYPNTELVRGSIACDVRKGGQRGGHDYGIAFDWGLWQPEKKPLGDAFVKWLLAKDRHGNKHAYARRLGVAMIIWHNRIWTANDRKWRRYSSKCVGQRGGAAYCHRDHVHVEFSQDGARRRTSWWREQGNADQHDRNGDLNQQPRR